MATILPDIIDTRNIKLDCFPAQIRPSNEAQTPVVSCFTEKNICRLAQSVSNNNTSMTVIYGQSAKQQMIVT